MKKRFQVKMAFEAVVEIESDSEAHARADAQEIMDSMLVDVACDVGKTHDDVAHMLAFKQVPPTILGVEE